MGNVQNVLNFPKSIPTVVNVFIKWHKCLWAPNSTCPPLALLSLQSNSEAKLLALSFECISIVLSQVISALRWFLETNRHFETI